jgi:hypothetical protein
LDGTTDDMRCSESCEPFTAGTDEYRRSFKGLDAPFFAELLQRAREIGSQRQDPFLSAFPAEEDVRRPIQPQVRGVDPDRLRHASASAREKQEERVVSPTRRGLLVGRTEQRIDGRRRQMARGLQHRALAGNFDHPLRDGQRCRIARRHVTEEGPNRRQARVSRAGSIVALSLDVFKETEHDISVEIAHLKSTRFSVSSPAFAHACRKADRIPVAVHRSPRRLKKNAGEVAPAYARSRAAT